MKRHHSKTNSNFEKDSFRKSKYDFLRLHLGTNSIFLALVFSICVAISIYTNVFNWNYLKGVNDDLSFFIGLFSIIFGVGFYKFWRLGEKSVYTIHFVKSKFMPKEANVIFAYKDITFGVSNQTTLNTIELPSIIRGIFCVGIFLSLILIVLDNGEFEKLKVFPNEILDSESNFCSDKVESIENIPPKEGCELIIRAYKLGYAKDLGLCEPKKIDPKDMKICQKRRDDEPYLHYMSRLLLSSIEKQVDFFENNKVKNISDKFELQLQKIEVLKDYQAYAMSAAPRASHHIWTNLPYPENDFIQIYRELFKPSYCIEQFQNQANTVRLDDDDARVNSKLMEHVYGQLLFNPKSKLTVGFCKEYKIHWDSDVNICERLANNPRAVLQEENVLSEVEMVLKRHDNANAILNLEEEIREIENLGSKSSIAKSDASQLPDEQKSRKKPTSNIVKSKIAKEKQEIRKKNEIVSFQCFMQENEADNRNIESMVKLKGTKFLIRTQYFPIIERKAESQISMYKEFSKVLENRFHYSQLTSRSDINIEDEIGDTPNDKKPLEEPSYLLSRLEILKNVDIFLGDIWVLERDDLLGIYPYHVHLQNYVKSFRVEYQKSRGRL